jgi:hypothetical protein
MNKLCCLIIMFITCGVCSGQNLVPNPSFEDTVSCPIMGGQINLATGWENWGYTPDYYNSCNPGLIGTPSNGFGYQVPLEGNAYAGMVCNVSTMGNVREFIGRALSQPLIIGQNYYVSFYVVLSDIPSAICAINKIGVKFSTVSFSVSTPPPLTNSAQVYSNAIVSDTLNWTKISGWFTADSAYSYIMLGVFFDNSQLDTMNCPPNFGTESYYFFDMICVSTDSLTCNPPVGINEVTSKEELVLFPNPFSDKINITARRNDLVEVNFFDVTARKIFNQSFKNSTSINTEQLAKGIYLYEVRNKNGVIKKGKVVKD